MQQPRGLADPPRPRVDRRLRAHIAWLRADARRKSQRRRLLAQFPKDATGAEIGSWKGDFAAQLLTQTRPRLLYLVDPWEHREETTYEQAMFGGQGSDGTTEMQAVYASVLDRFSADIAQGRVLVRRSRSVEAAAAFADGELDWAYIDGDHTYEAVKADLEAYYRVLRPGGLLAGDDYGVPGWWEDGVTRAVDEFAGSGRTSAPTIIGAQFLFTKM